MSHPPPLRPKRTPFIPGHPFRDASDAYNEIADHQVISLRRGQTFVTRRPPLPSTEERGNQTRVAELRELALFLLVHEGSLSRGARDRIEDALEASDTLDGLDARQMLLQAQLLLPIIRELDPAPGSTLWALWRPIEERLLDEDTDAKEEPSEDGF